MYHALVYIVEKVKVYRNDRAGILKVVKIRFE